MNKNLVIFTLFFFLFFGCIATEDVIVDGDIEEDVLEEVGQKYAHNLFLEGKVSLCKVFSNDELVEILDLKSNKIMHERIRLDLGEIVTTSCTFSSFENENIKISYISSFSQDDLNEEMMEKVEKGVIEDYEYIYYPNEDFSMQTMYIFVNSNLITLTTQKVNLNKENMIDLAKSFLSKVDLNKVETHQLKSSSKVLNKYEGKYLAFDYPSNWEANIHYYDYLEDKVALEDPDGMIVFLIGTSDYGFQMDSYDSEEGFKEFAENLAEESNSILLGYKLDSDYYLLIFEQEEIISFMRIGMFGNKFSVLMGMYEKYRYDFYEQDIHNILDSIKPA